MPPAVRREREGARRRAVRMEEGVVRGDIVGVGFVRYGVVRFLRWRVCDLERTWRGVYGQERMERGRDLVS